MNLEDSMSEAQACLVTLPDIAPDMEKGAIKEADIVYTSNYLMDQIYQDSKEEKNEISYKESTEDELVIAALIAEDLKSIDNEYNLLSQPMNTDRGEMTNTTKTVTTSRSHPDMTHEEIEEEIRSSIKITSHAQSIIEMIDTLYTKVHDMRLFDVRISCEKGVSPKYRITLDIPYGLVISKDIERSITEDVDFYWTVTWFHNFSHAQRRHNIVMTVTPKVVDLNELSIKANKKEKDTRSRVSKKENMIEPKGVLPVPLYQVKPKESLETSDFVVSEKEIHTIVNSYLVYPMSTSLTSLIIELVNEPDSPKITSLDIEEGIKGTFIVRIRLTTGHGSPGGLSLTTMNKVVESFKNDWKLDIRAMFDKERSLMIRATYLKEVKSLTMDDVHDLIIDAVHTSAHRSPITNMIGLITGDATEHVIHAMEVKQLSTHYYRVAIDLDKKAVIPRKDETLVMDHFNDQWAIAFQHSYLKRHPIHRVIMGVNYRSYILSNQ